MEDPEVLEGEILFCKTNTKLEQIVGVKELDIDICRTFNLALTMVSVCLILTKTNMLLSSACI